MISTRWVCGNAAGHRPALVAIPKGLRPPAQGWRARGYLRSRLGDEHNPKGVASNSFDDDGSIPHITNIPFDFVLFQQRAQLVLESDLAMMLLLSGDVFLHLFEIRLAHGKIRVAALPLEVGVIATALLQPEVRDAFQFLHPFGLRDGASETREQMDVILHASDQDGWAIESFGDAAKIRMECIARRFVAHERSAVFGGEDEMDVNG